MASFWRARNGWWHLRLGWRHFCRQIARERFKDNLVEAGRVLGRGLGIWNFLKKHGQRAGLVAPRDWDGSPHQESPERRAETSRYHNAQPASDIPDPGARPLIFVSCCIDESPRSGGGKFNGGVKELNLLVHLLRRHGYEAWMVTADGDYEPWLVDHAPHISLAEYRRRLGEGRLVRCVTSFAVAKAFIDPAPGIYFWDMELALTDQHHLPLLARFYTAGTVLGAAAISRTIQAWTMATFGQECVTIPNLLDEAVFHPAPARRIAGRVGYMNEGDHCEQYVASIQKYCAERGRELTFVRVFGDEQACIDAFATCDLYLSLNLGKDLFWGEGCPRTIIEAMSHGCVLLAFDVIGNREMIIDGFNGCLFPLYRVDLMAARVLELSGDEALRERMRANTLSLVETCHKLEDRWPAVRQFLDLP